ncbi:hypothetical protein XENTR_v10003782 [Xenopus tropicalis]|nr:hypothetical protein XENTR_v10003782 [Xenopus tropicalis]
MSVRCWSVVFSRDLYWMYCVFVLVKMCYIFGTQCIMLTLGSSACLGVWVDLLGAIRLYAMSASFILLSVDPGILICSPAFLLYQNSHKSSSYSGRVTGSCSYKGQKGSPTWRSLVLKEQCTFTHAHQVPCMKSWMRWAIQKELDALR